MPTLTGTGAITGKLKGRRRLRAIDLVDVLVYLVVLGLFVQFVPSVISESFVVSLATAVLLKIVLELVVAAKKNVVGRLRTADTATARAIASVVLVVIMAGSKFLVLWLTDVALGGAVYLGGFVSVTVLIVVLMLSRALVRRVIQ